MLLLLFIAAGGLASLIAVSIFQAITSPLRSVPGPFLARFTRLWYFARVAAGHFEAENIALHRRYGPVVRLAPGMYSIDTPAAVGAVYGIGTRMPKSAWYDCWQHPGVDRWSVFSDRDVKRHAETRRRFQALYSMTSMVSYESYADECTEMFLRKLDGFAEKRESVNMTRWFHCYAFDVIGDITYSKRFGFLDRGEDVAGLQRALHSVSVYSTMAGILPELHPVLYRVMDWLGIGGAAGLSYLMDFVRERVDQRRKERASPSSSHRHEDGAGKEKGAPAARIDDEGRPQSFLDKLLDQNEREPDKVFDYHIFMMSMANIIAGADTTAIALAAILYHLTQNPSALSRLRSEVAEQLEAKGKLQGGRVRFKDAQDLLYLQAVIKEAMRLHTVVGLPLWRDVTEGGGLPLAGRVFPRGSSVGINTWVAHYNEDVFGEDAGEFRPERWLLEGDDKEERVRRMNGYFLPFGLGTRNCLGRHISMLEMCKLVPLLVRDYDFELVNGSGPWKVRSCWFVKPVDFYVRVKRRV